MASGIEDQSPGALLAEPLQDREGWPWARAAGPGPRARRYWPRISVVTPSFNQGRYLEATLRSVLLQGYPLLELIVVDGGSDDESLEILRHYQAHLSSWTSEPDRGQAHAINKGLERSTGDVLGWLNSDDLLLPGSLARIGRAFARSAETHVVSGLRQEVRADGTIAGPWVRDLPRPHRLRAYCCVPQETVYWRRTVWEAIGGLDETKAFALDYEYWLRMLESGYRFTELPFFLGGCRDHPQTKRATRNDDRDRDLASIYRAYGLGLNEEAVLMGQGPEWSFRMQLLDDLSGSSWFTNARRATATLRLLEQPSVSRRAVSVYMRYKLRRFEGDTRSRARVVARVVADEVLSRDPKRLEPFLLPSSPVQRARRPSHVTADDDTIDRGPFDELAIGRGWSWLEVSSDRVYRWAEGDAELLVLRPSGTRTRLRLDLDPGPALAWQLFDLAIFDEDDREIQRCHVNTGSPVLLALPLAAGPRSRCFRLHAPATDPSTGGVDSRVLAFRATWVGWDDEDEFLRDLVLDGGRTVPVRLQAPDILDTPVATVQIGDRRRRVPRDGLFLGRGWWPVTGIGVEAFRNTGDGSELIVTKPSSDRFRIVLDVEPAPGFDFVEVALNQADGTVAAEAVPSLVDRREVAFEVKARVGVTCVVRLRVTPAGPRSLRVHRVSRFDD